MDFSQRLQALEDIEAIKRLKYDYFFFCDHKQPNKVKDCFMEGEVKIDYGRIGCFDNRETLVAVFSQLACAENIVEMHHAQNPRIDVDGDSANGVWGIYYYMIDTLQNSVTQLGGYYEDEYRKIESNWKISATVFHVTSTVLTDIASGVANIIFAGGAAPAELDDPSKQAS
ncbi:MAG: nuclear transport factor 2 family protein [Pseudomonadales bacterium]